MQAGMWPSIGVGSSNVAYLTVPPPKTGPILPAPTTGVTGTKNIVPADSIAGVTETTTSSNTAALVKLISGSSYAAGLAFALGASAQMKGPKPPNPTQL